MLVRTPSTSDLALGGWLRQQTIATTASDEALPRWIASRIGGRARQRHEHRFGVPHAQASRDRHRARARDDDVGRGVRGLPDRV